jgi:hypothetical protein
VLLPAYNKSDRARFRIRSSTINEPESPPARNLLPLLFDHDLSGEGFVKAAPPAHSLS